MDLSQIAEEMSDVLFGSFCIALLTKIDISHSMGVIAGNSTFKDIDSSYEQLQGLVLQNLDKFNLDKLTTSRQVVLSLVNQTSQLADIFVWYTPEQSMERAQEKHSFISAHIAHIIAHLIYLSHLIDVNLPTEYISKMQKNCIKYPTNKSSGEDYIEIKDKSRGRKN